MIFFETINECSFHNLMTNSQLFKNETTNTNNCNDYLLLQYDVGNLNISQFYVNLRFALHKRFYQGKTYRIPIYCKYLVFDAI